jgi:hypothetical protein
MARQARQPISPEGPNFMRSQNGPAKAKLLNMHTKALIRPFDKSSGDKASSRIAGFADPASPVHKSVRNTQSRLSTGGRRDSSRI